MPERTRQLGVWPKTVRHWRSRWLSGPAEAAAGARLADEPRPGAPATFTPEQVCAIVALACEPPEKSELPLSHCSQSELAREAVRRGIVDSISHGSVGRYLKRGRPQTASGARWLTPKVDPEFECKCAEVCTPYHEAPAAAQQDVHTVSVDAMTGVQALERAPPTCQTAGGISAVRCVYGKLEKSAP